MYIYILYILYICISIKYMYIYYIFIYVYDIAQDLNEQRQDLSFASAFEAKVHWAMEGWQTTWRRRPQPNGLQRATSGRWGLLMLHQPDSS